jgi:ATP-dependent Clp protease ATP-binding subunit ClpC
MFERYSEKARRAIFFASCETNQFGSSAIETEHLLLGILLESPELLLSLVGDNAVESVRERIPQQYPVQDRDADSVELPFTEEAKHVLNSALQEADQPGNRTIEPEHILIGLLREEDCLAQKILNELGVTLETVRRSMNG